jgi:DNA-binding transcriptional regulator YiaG
MIEGRSFTSGPTSGGSPFGAPTALVMVGIMFVGTRAGADEPPRVEHVMQSQTSSGTPAPTATRAGAAIGVLRRLSGLTWDQLARLLGVSRRSLHFWASGKPMASGNEERLQRLVGVMRYVDRGSARANRAALLSAQKDGTIPFDLLTDGQYERVMALLGVGGATRITAPKQSPRGRAEAAPPPPHELLDALHDPVHRRAGGARAAKSVKVRGGR